MGFTKCNLQVISVVFLIPICLGLTCIMVKLQSESSMCAVYIYVHGQDSFNPGFKFSYQQYIIWFNSIN